MKKVSYRPFTFVPEVSNYSRGIFLFRKVRSFYSLLSIYSERIFFCKKKVSCKSLSFVPEVSNSSRWEINYSEFLKAPRQMVWEVSNYSRRIFRNSSVKYPHKQASKSPYIVNGKGDNRSWVTNKCTRLNGQKNTRRY